MLLSNDLQCPTLIGKAQLEKLALFKAALFNSVSGRIWQQLRKKKHTHTKKNPEPVLVSVLESVQWVGPLVDQREQWWLVLSLDWDPCAPTPLLFSWGRGHAPT